MTTFLRILTALALSCFAGAAASQSCTPSAPRTDTGAGFTPFGPTEYALARGGQSGPAWEWAIGPDAGGAQQAQGSLDWISGKVFDWTVSYSGAGAATLQVRDAGTLVLNLTYPSAMDTGNALKLHVSTNPAVGSGTTIAATVSQVSGSAVSGALSQTGNGTNAEQNLYFFYPGMASGFTAQGTVSLTYASLPAGSKVQFYAQAGNIPCGVGNTPPTVAITNPAANAVFNAPGTIAVTASATDADGTVTQVQFFANGNPIGTATSAPFTINWAGVGAGSYSLTAIATDNIGATISSAAVPIIVNAPPTVSMTSPAAGATYNAPATITLTANATDSDGTITQVQFFDGATPVGAVTSAPYTVTLTGVVAGAHSYAAVATDNRGATTTSAAVAVSVNALPSVSITAPAANAVFNAPANITVTASAIDTDGTIAQVQFFANGNPIGTASAAPFTISWASVVPGSYSLTAIATDNSGATFTSAAVPIKVNALPTVTLTSPANGATFTAPASITLSATAADADGTIASVSFYRGGSTLIATVNTAPYTYPWTSVPAGSYAITAVATDNDGASTTSDPVTVSNPQAKLFFIHADHLNTPRLVADATGTTVWRWDQTEPFGNNPADENPSGLGAFDLPLRLPGQRYDAETGLHYNYFRDYDPSLGIYKQSDPLGIAAGLNTYAYAWSPLLQTDPKGLMGQGSGANGWRSVPRPPSRRPDGQPWGYGCGNASTDRYIPDSWGGFDFLPACRAHDVCYDTCGPTQGQCDKQFLPDLMSECMKRGSYSFCAVLSLAYWRAVTAGGKDSFDAAQRAAGCVNCK